MECFIEPFMYWSVLKKSERVLTCYACPLDEITLLVEIIPTYLTQSKLMLPTEPHMVMIRGNTFKCLYYSLKATNNDI